MMPLGFRQPRTKFVCARCQGPGDLSSKYVTIKRRMGQPLLCKACRDWSHHQHVKHGTSGCVSEGMRAARKRDTMRVGECVIVATQGGRCRDWFKCPESKHWQCLSVAAARNWEGYERKEVLWR